MSEQNFPKYRQRLNLLMKRLSKELAGPVSGFAQLRRRHAFEALEQFETERAEEAAQKQASQEGDC